MPRVVGAKREQNDVAPSARGAVRPAGSRPPTKPVRNSPGMSRSIHCLHCGVSLNLPPQADGRRVKCPKCGGRFQVGNTGDAPAPAAATPNAPDPDSTLLLTRKPSSIELPVMPVAAGDLRETFDLTLMTGEASQSKGQAAIPANSHGEEAADARSLFQDEPVAPRRKKGAEARSASRRCPTCGGVVPVGMSICQSCGLDLETGRRVGLDDDLSPPPPPRNAGLPLPMLIVGGLACAASAALMVLAAVLWRSGTAGANYFIPIAGFGVYASVQFLREKSVRLLLIAFTIGAVVDLVGLVALPIAAPLISLQTVQRTGPAEDPNDADVAIKNAADRLDMRKLTTGIIILMFYAALSVYLLSPQVQKHYRR